ncbi:DUF2190 family protein [Paracoccus yeei]|uniref:Recombinase RecA n=1 Tax=Paracoccus yeei TaxID=147645 RepID=A0A2D2C1Z9_9RHOB|nr:DUF2190 family protein [Paracoccus yeei]ATQ56550.1 recombinase RecA [Paracoccus yeei]
MKIFVNSGSTATITATRDIVSGELVAEGALVGFAQADAAEGDLVAIVTEGVFQVDVLTATDVELGDVIYLDAGSLTTDATDTVRAGVAYSAGTSDGVTATVNVKINT